MPTTPAWDNLDDFLQMDDFAVQAVIVQGGVTRPAIPCIFDEPYLNAQIGEFEMDSSQPRIHAKEADLIGVRRGATCTVAGKTYAVMDAPKPDGNGMAILKLAIEP